MYTLYLCSYTPVLLTGISGQSYVLESFLSEQIYDALKGYIRDKLIKIDTYIKKILCHTLSFIARCLVYIDAYMARK